jgi:uncharacterized membrane protein
MKEQPKLKLVLSTVEKIFEIVGWVLMLLVWFFTIAKYSNIPETIPIHYNFANQVDRFGGKSTIFSLPLIATIIFMRLTAINKFPHLFNYPTKITRENALSQYTNATRAIRYLKFSIVLIFGLIVFETIQPSNGEGEVLGIWGLPLCLGLGFIPLLYFVIKSFKI